MLDLVILGAILVAIVVLIIVLSAYFKKRKRDERLRKLRAIAQQSDGRVFTGASTPAPRSAALLPPSGGTGGGWVDSVTMLKQPQYEFAIDLWRGRWFIRAAQASCERASVNGPGNTVTITESRIEIEIAECPAMKIGPLVSFGKTDAEGNPIRWLLGAPEDPPVSVAQPGRNDNAQWKNVQLPHTYAEQLQAFTSDKNFSSSILNEEGLQWLAQYLPSLQTGLTIEQGLLYIHWNQGINADTLVSQIDALVGFLDRTPIQPGDPSGQGSQRGHAQA